MAATGVAFLKAKELQLSLDAFEEALTHVCGRSKVQAERRSEESLELVSFVFRNFVARFRWCKTKVLLRLGSSRCPLSLLFGYLQ